MTVAADCRPSPCVSQSSTASRTVYPLTLQSGHRPDRARGPATCSSPRSSSDRRPFAQPSCHGRSSQSWSLRSTAAGAHPNAARRPRGHDESRPTTQRVDVTRTAPTPAPTAGGPVSQSVADPSESAHRGRTYSAAVLPAASSTSYSTAGTAGLLSATAMIALPFPGAITGLPSVRVRPASRKDRLGISCWQDESPAGRVGDHSLLRTQLLS